LLLGAGYKYSYLLTYYYYYYYSNSITTVIWRFHKVYVLEVSTVQGRHLGDFTPRIKTNFYAIERREAAISVVFVRPSVCQSVCLSVRRVHSE